MAETRPLAGPLLSIDHLQVVTPVDDDRPYGPWGGLGIMALWVIAALVGGYLTLRKRDA